MIVKIKTEYISGEGWSYFECSIAHAVKKNGIVKEIVGLGENVILWKGNKNPEENDRINYTRISLETEKSHLRTIITDAVCYLLNDQGKTIDKL